MLPPVLILHNEPRSSAADGAWRESDASVLDEVRAVREALGRLGAPCRAVGARRLDEVPAVLAASPEPVVFNLVEELHGGPAEAALVPALCESCGKASTGGDTPCLERTLDKWNSKVLLEAAGLNCPPGVVVCPGERLRAADLPARGPYIVKPLRADASEGIDAHSVFDSLGAPLRRAVTAIHREFNQPALVERFVGHRELNVSVLQRNGRAEVLPIAEIDFSAFGKERPRVVGYAAKWLPESFEYASTPRILPARLPAKAAAGVRRAALAAWRALGCRDYARVDFRLNRRLRPVVLEVNANPDVSPDAGFAAALDAAGFAYDGFVRAMVENAAARVLAEKKPERRAVPQVLSDGAIRRTGVGDRQAILDLLAGTRFFHAHELEVAREVLDDALDKGPGGHYQSYCYADGGRPVGWVCFGRTPCTTGTFDMYWIAVAPGHQGRGIGRSLAEFAEARIAEAGGRMAVAETAGRAAYEPTRRFYQQMGYVEAGRIKDFYDCGDARIIYTKSVLKQRGAMPWGRE